MDATADNLRRENQFDDATGSPPASAPVPKGNRLVNLILGRPLATQEQEHVKIGVLAAVPAMGLDALGSASYGPEAALTILLPLGALGLTYLWPITLVIVALLTILYFSYRQTIAAYPVNGGSYTVATENLGVWPGLLAAAALMIDYLLNVAVGISAGVAALISAAPALHRFTLPLCLGILLIITLLNLRGTGEAGLAFAVPTYLFILTLFVAVGTGIFRTIASGGHPHAVLAPPPIHPALEPVRLWLILRAFASGCTAMTGVEAVSNSVAAFRPPTVQHAHRTLTIIVVVLGLLLVGISWLSRSYGIAAMDQDKPGYQSVISQMLGAVMGRNWLYFVTISSVLAVLCLSANTSFVDFPRLCRLIAAHDFLPRGFAIVGRRLVYSVGVVVLASFAALLLVVFGGITDRLIPLFAVGAFLAFSLSQAGMVMHWRKEVHSAAESSAKTRAWMRMGINGIGAVCTGIALLIILSAKFVEGAWICVVAIPLLLMMFHLIHHHYKQVAKQTAAVAPLDLEHNQPPVVLITTKGWDRLTEKALRFAFWISSDVIALHIINLNGEEAAEEDRIRAAWHTNVETPAQRHGVPAPRLDIRPAPFRSIINPLLKELDRLEQEFPTRQIAVLTPRVVEKHWWNLLLHRQKSGSLRAALFRRCDDRVVIISMPWYIDE